MEEPEQARAYALADFEEPNTRFLELLDSLSGASRINGRVVDLGCGPADIAMRLLERWPNCTVDAVDGSPEMIQQADERLTRSAQGCGWSRRRCRQTDSKTACTTM